MQSRLARPARPLPPDVTVIAYLDPPRTTAQLLVDPTRPIQIVSPVFTTPAVAASGDMVRVHFGVRAPGSSVGGVGVTTPTSQVAGPSMWSKSGSASMAMDCPFVATDTSSAL